MRLRNIFCVLMALLFTAPLLAQSHKEIMEHKWVGHSKVAVDFTKSGYVFLKQEMDMDFDRVFNMTGHVTTTFTLDDVDYVCEAALSGKYNPETYKLNWKSGKHYSEDELPYGLQWCNGWGELEVRDFKDHPGYYVLMGTTYDDCGGESEMRLTDHPDNH